MHQLPSKLLQIQHFHLHPEILVSVLSLFKINLIKCLEIKNSPKKKCKKNTAMQMKKFSIKMKKKDS